MPSAIRSQSAIRDPKSAMTPRHALHVRRHRIPVDRAPTARSDDGRRRARRQQMPLGEQRTCPRYPARAAGLDQHARQPRMQRQAADLFTDCGQMQRIADCGLADQRTAMRPRRVEQEPAPRRARLRADVRTTRACADRRPRRCTSSDRARRDRCGGSPARGAGAGDRARPTAAARRRDAVRPARPGALIRGVGGDALGLEAVDAAVGVVARDLVQAGCRSTAVTPGTVSDVSAMLVATMMRRRGDERSAAILLVGVERPVQRHDLDAAAGRVTAARRSRGGSPAAPGRKHSTLAAGRAQHVRPPRRRPTARRDRRRRSDTCGPRHVDDRTAVEKRRHRAATRASPT